MGLNLEVVRYKCDWINEFGHTCPHTQDFTGRNHRQAANDAGWGAYNNAHIRNHGPEHWFCPVHATVFSNNHGWGGLERFAAPTRWWDNFYWRKK